MDIPLLFMELDMSSDRMGEVPLRMGKCVPLAKFWSTTFLPFHLPIHFISWDVRRGDSTHVERVTKKLSHAS